MNIAQSLKALMSERKLSNSKLAREIHVHTSTVGNWLDGKDVKAENLETLCEYFGCSLDYLVGADGAKKAPTPEGEPKIKNPDIRMIARAGCKMTPDQAKNLRKYAEFMFPEAFKDDNT